MNWLILSIIALLFWSGSDLFSKIGSRPDEKTSHWRMVIAVGIVMGIHALIEIIGGVEFTPADMITYLPASACYISSMVLGYVGLRYIELSLSTPICNCSGAIAGIMCFFLLGQEMNNIQIFGVVLIVIAIISIGFIEQHDDPELREASGLKQDIKYRKSVLAFVLPLMYCFLDALGTFADAMLLDTGRIPEDRANVAYEITFFIMAICGYIFVRFVKKEKYSFPHPKNMHEAPKYVGALCETAGQFAYVYAIGANAVLAAPVISAYCLLSVIWSRLLLHEKLELKHYLMIGLAITGIVILGVAEGLEG